MSPPTMVEGFPRCHPVMVSADLRYQYAEMHLLQLKALRSDVDERIRDHDSENANGDAQLQRSKNEVSEKIELAKKALRDASMMRRRERRNNDAHPNENTVDQGDEIAALAKRVSDAEAIFLNSKIRLLKLDLGEPFEGSHERAAYDTKGDVKAWKVAMEAYNNALKPARESLEATMRVLVARWEVTRAPPRPMTPDDVSKVHRLLDMTDAL